MSPCPTGEGNVIDLASGKSKNACRRMRWIDANDQPLEVGKAQKNAADQFGITAQKRVGLPSNQTHSAAALTGSTPGGEWLGAV